MRDEAQRAEGGKRQDLHWDQGEAVHALAVIVSAVVEFLIRGNCANTVTHQVPPVYS